MSNIEVSYGGIKAVWGVSMHAEKGSIVGLLGPNGAGKTSTFQTVPGLIQPEVGGITFDGKEITNVKASERVDLGIAYVPEGRRLFPYMSVYDNLLMGSYSKRARKRRDDLLEKVYQIFPKLKERIDQQARTLSGGEQQMLAVGRGLMSDPKLLILDEPSLGLAPIIVQDLFKIFEEINQQGVTILISEQHVAMVMSVMDKGYVIEDGKIVLEGTAEELSGNEHVKKAYLGI